ncbi:Glycoside hydrolase, family 35 [Niveomyces insectorum RCEF 264]|uniref:Glycoside hydrolase, family 35 n=1 Tax=Niveomyces insectorum RCEF 264 TaxID=1081102 RepID=A0A162MTP7_9HYPO|nr:Glycoside hydrolase, family 35 [Niveomyces insectorum RCEF 264]
MLLSPPLASLLCTCACIVGAVAVAGAAAGPSGPATPVAAADLPAFTYNADTFLLHGRPYVIIGGQMDPQRVPPAYWADRVAKARAMGLNTVFSYVYWNLLEPQPGQWAGGAGSGANDIARFFRLAADAGLHVVLRPGPYVCGEREWGGFPAWLAQVPNMTVRSANAAFLAHATRYLTRLAADLRDTQITRSSDGGGGALIMVQVENEYGSYGTDHAYTAALRDTLRAVFDVPLYTNDGGVDWTLAGGSVPGVLAAVDGDPQGGFAARRRYVTDPSMLGPLLDGEYYTLAPDIWGASAATNRHNAAAEPGSAQAAQFVRDIEGVLRANNSISLYMFHGGTNFGFGNGALWRAGNVTAPFTTSYDYGAPLDESGRTTDLYALLRATLVRYAAGAGGGPAGSTNTTMVPTPPANVPRMSLPAPIALTPYASLFDVAKRTNASRRRTGPSPVTMEALGQAYGFVLYEHRVPRNATTTPRGLLQPGDRARDRVLVYVNGARVGVMDSTYPQPAAVHVDLQAEPDDDDDDDTVLQLLAENLGRVDYYSREARTTNALLDPAKGIVGDVTVGGTVVRGWTSTALPLDGVPDWHRNHSHAEKTILPADTPLFYHGTFTVDTPADNNTAALDTFLAVPNGTKGVVWVNGFNLGRYWVVGPQQSLYVPGTLLRAGRGTTNDVVVLELEPTAAAAAAAGQTMTAVAQAERVWANHADPDAP